MPHASGTNDPWERREQVGAKLTLGALLVGIRAIGPGSTGAQNPVHAACPEIGEALTERGRAVFTGRGNCSACHGPDATGGPLAPDLTDGEWLNMDTSSYEKVAALVREGVPSPVSHPAPMPPKGGADLSDQEVCAVAAYVISLGD